MTSRLAFPVYAFALFALIFCVNAPAPLFDLFRQKMHLEPDELALLYSVYSAVIILALPISGRLSDRFGRRRSVVCGLGLAALGCSMIAGAEDLPGLLAGRLAQALAVAAMSAPSAAALAELSPTGAAAGALAATLAMAFGGSLGPIVSGLIAESVSAQQSLPMVLSASLAGVAAFLVLMIPAPAKVRSVREEGTVSETSRYGAAFLTACATVVIAFGVQSTFFTMSGPRFSALLGARALVSAGASMGIFMLASGSGMIVGRRLPSTVAMSAGLVLLPVGISLFFRLIDSSPLAFVAVAVLTAGAGHGLAYVGALRRINELAPPLTRGRYTSLFYVAIYIGGGLPVLLMGLLARITGLSVACEIFSAVVSAASIPLLLYLRPDLRAVVGRLRGISSGFRRPPTIPPSATGERPI